MTLRKLLSELIVALEPPAPSQLTGNGWIVPNLSNIVGKRKIPFSFDLTALSNRKVLIFERSNFIFRREFSYLNNNTTSTGHASTSSHPPARLAWEGTAYCLKNWKDPMKFISGYKQEAQHACEVDGSANIFA